jgi:hypothetical protein
MLNLNTLRHKGMVSAFHEGVNRPLCGVFVSHYNPRISKSSIAASAAGPVRPGPGMRAGLLSMITYGSLLS